MVLDQPALSEGRLDGRSQQDDHSLQGPVAPEDVGAIVDYLTRLRGAK
jgi:hypothetical protein